MTNEELVARIQNGERARMVELWEQVERFVSMQAGRRARSLEGFGGVTEEDLYQSGYLALVAAADSFDPAAGRSFVSWLALALKTAFAEAAGYRTKKRDPLSYSASLDKPLDDESSDTLGDLQENPAATQAMQEAENGIWREQIRAALDKALSELPADQSGILRRRCYDGWSIRQIAAETDRRPAAARRREQKALLALRRRRELRRFVELRTNYYMSVSARTGERTVEVIALRREEMARRWDESRAEAGQSGPLECDR